MSLIPKRPVPLESKRIPLDRRILMRFTSFEWFAAEYSQNLSMTGMFVRSSEPQPAGTPLEFEFKLQEGQPLIKGKGWVVWSREADLGGDRPAGMGIEFLELDRESRRLIRWMVQNELPEDREPFDLRAVQNDEPDGSEPGEDDLDGGASGWVPVIAGVLVVALAFLGHWWWRGRESVAPPGDPEPSIVVDAGDPQPVAGSESTDPASPGAPGGTEEPVRDPSASDASALTKDLEQAVRAWARAWSSQDVEAYLSSYSPSFDPEGGGSLEEWRAQRRQRLLAPARIRIAVTGFEVVSSGGDEAEVRFTQAYRSETYSDSVQKTLELVREGGGWKIRREVSG